MDNQPPSDLSRSGPSISPERDKCLRHPLHRLPCPFCSSAAVPPGPAAPPPEPLLAKIRARIHGLVNRGAEICEAYQPRDPLASNPGCNRCGYLSDVHLLRDVLLSAGPAAPPPEPLRALVQKWRDVQNHPDARFGGCTSREEIDIVKHVHQRCANELAALLAGPAAPQTAAPPKPSCCRMTDPCSEDCVDDWIAWEAAQTAAPPEQQKDDRMQDRMNQR